MKKRFNTPAARCTALLLTLAMILSLTVVFSFSASAADPTVFFPDDTGVFHIKTAQDLKDMCTDRATYASYAGKTIVLDADIDLNPDWVASTKTAPSYAWASQWTMSGTFDGQGHTIKGIYISNTAANACSFFRNASNLTLKNITFANSYFKGGQSTGFIACLQGICVIDNVTVSSDVIMEGGSSSGGIVGCFNKADGTHVIKNCVVNADLKFGNYSAGILGNTNNLGKLEISNCTFGGTFAGNDIERCAGIVGSCDVPSTITNCVSTGKFNVTGESKIAAIAVVNAGTADKVVNFVDCSYVKDTACEVACNGTRSTGTVDTRVVTYNGVEAGKQVLETKSILTVAEGKDVSLFAQASADGTKVRILAVSADTLTMDKDMVITFKKGDSAIRTFNISASEFATFASVEALGETLYSKTGTKIFGAIINNIPADTLTGASVEVTFGGTLIGSANF